VVVVPISTLPPPCGASRRLGLRLGDASPD
jgi:hypothetical protein